jgi:hypothetical protein
MQDPWHSDYYQNKPKEYRPPKYWFSYRLNKWMEPVAMKHVDGLISVSDPYLEVLQKRYDRCQYIPQRTITFGAFDKDFQIASANRILQPSYLQKCNGKINVVYVGRGGHDMKDAVSLLFHAFKQCLDENEIFQRFHFYFIGTNYASAGKGSPFITPWAKEEGINDYVTEVTDRIPFYQTLNTLADATGLFIPGSNDPKYTASKIYPYVMAGKPLLALFHKESSVVSFLQKCGVGTVLTFDQKRNEQLNAIKTFLYSLAANGSFNINPDTDVLKEYSADAMTRKQCELFNEVVR